MKHGLNKTVQENTFGRTNHEREALKFLHKKGAGLWFAMYDQ
jgi:hypothetical protein